MRKCQLALIVWMVFLSVFIASPALRAQSIENFRWLDLRQSSPQQQSDVETIVARALMNEPYTALREIGYIGLPPKETATPQPKAAAAAASSNAASSASKLSVPRDAHLLVITAQRTNPSALPEDDVLSVYDVNQRQITATLLLRGPGLRLLGWLRLWREGSPELVATYNDCTDCQRTTFFTTFHIDMKTEQWRMRWPRSTAGAPIFSEGQEANGGEQVYALLDDEAGRVVLGTWAHFSTHGRPDTDVVYAYRVEYYGSHEATEPIIGPQARAFEQRLCGGQGVLFGLADGQDTALCRSIGVSSAPQSLATRRRHRAH
ncbi:MAG TPA: hypothetical protein VH139_06990 [Acidobacteriaceae bacterium]|jgi:hypothetical protein|nr:hypothetical protein [Acidobacteriaceae bacterium]